MQKEEQKISTIPFLKTLKECYLKSVKKEFSFKVHESILIIKEGGYRRNISDLPFIIEEKNGDLVYKLEGKNKNLGTVFSNEKERDWFFDKIN